MKTIEDYNTLVKTYIDTKDSAKAPTDHSSTATTYGVGSTTKYGHVKVDDALSSTSTNPVQNKKVYELKQALTNESALFGVHNFCPLSLDNLKQINSQGAWNGNVYYVHNVAFTVNEADGSISIKSNGALAQTYNFTLATLVNGGNIVNQDLYEKMFNKKIHIDGCPSGGASNTYCITMARYDAAGNLAYDTGNGIDFTYTKGATVGDSWIAISLVAGTTFNDMVYKPLFCYQDEKDFPYQIPTKTNAELTQDSVGLMNNVNTMGAKNYFDINKVTTYYAMALSNGVFANSSTDTRSPLRFFIAALSSSDTTIQTLVFENITATGKKSFNITIPSGTAKLQFGNSGQQSNEFIKVDTSNISAGDYQFVINFTGVNPTVVGGFSFKEVMICGQGLNTDYAPYAMTNRELTDGITPLLPKSRLQSVEALTVETGWNCYDTWVERSGNVVHIGGSASYSSDIATGTSVKVATLKDTSIAPKSVERIIGGCGTDAWLTYNPCYMIIDTNGIIYITIPTGVSADSINFNFTYII